jgi:hypothetical protein
MKNVIVLGVGLILGLVITMPAAAAAAAPVPADRATIGQAADTPAPVLLARVCRRWVTRRVCVAWRGGQRTCVNRIRRCTRWIPAGRQCVRWAIRNNQRVCALWRTTGRRCALWSNVCTRWVTAPKACLRFSTTRTCVAWQ